VGDALKAYVWDLETTNLRSDIGAIIVASFGELNANGRVMKMHTATINDFDTETEFVQWVVDRYSKADILIGHNSKAFDRNFLSGVMFRLGLGARPRRIHLDTMQVAKGMQFQSVSLSNLADILAVGHKDKPAKDDWREANMLNAAAIARLVKRCESDVRITAKVWNKLKPRYMESKGE
jgi:DNA polymerase III epsilon subunit-like protein